MPAELLTLRGFADAVGLPMTEVQADALTLERRITCLVAPRQTGKSRSLATLAVHRSLLTRGHQTLIVSAGEDAARRVLRQVRDLLASPLCRGVTVDEQAGVVTFVNGSTIRAVPASERAIRGATTDLLLLDEAAFVPDDLIYGAALLTVAARPDARIVFSSTPWEASGAFYTYATRTDDPQVRTVRWRLADAAWISLSFVEQMRATMPPIRFRAELEAEFIAGGAGFFSRDDLMAAVAPYRLVPPEQARGGTVLLGADYGNRVDSHAIVLLGVLDDYGLNHLPVLYAAWCETSQARYREQVARVATIARARPVRGGFRGGLTGAGTGRPVYVPGSDRGYDVAAIYSEAVGVGIPATEALVEELGPRVRPVVTTQESKERSFGRLLDLLSAGQLVLPDHPQLLRELAGLEATATAHGGLRIAAAGTGHDDLAMALSFCALGVGSDVRVGQPSPLGEAEGTVLRTPSGLAVPEVPSPRVGGLGRDRALLRSWA